MMGGNPGNASSLNRVCGTLGVSVANLRGGETRAVSLWLELLEGGGIGD